ncbi:MAG: hypothetical protein ACD_21C00209G0002 [uncultured bacterium]|nr:MAG: hypothetical protein ACD_21C00209G0002 [uncultured bacterium]
MDNYKEIIVRSPNENYYKCSAVVWDDVVKEVMRRKAKGQKTNLFSGDDEYEASCVKRKQPLKKKNLGSYGLGAKHGGACFTRREAECMVLLLNGKTTNSIAAILELSRSTVIDYIKNMKIKVGCRTKLELINLVSVSEFPKNVNF